VTGWRVYPAPFFCSGCSLRLLPSSIRFADWGLFGERGRLERDDSRHSLALWEILGRLGIESGVVGWPRAGSGGSGEAFVVPERLFLAGRPGVPGWPEGVESLVVRSRSAAGARAQEALARLPASSRRALAESVEADRWRLDVTLDLLSREPRVDATFLLLPGLGVTSRRTFGGFSAVQFDGSRRREARQASEELSSHYAFLDDLLREMWNLQGGPQVLAVVSVHGARTSQGWKRLVGGVRSARSVEGHFQGAPDGTLLLYGSGIKNGALVTGARLVDAVPTLLYALGLPLARDLDGRVLTGAFESDFLARNAVTFLPSFEGLPPRSGTESGR
jgi:hypothetical protein